MTTLEEIRMTYEPQTDYKAVVKRVFTERGIPDVPEKVERIINSMGESFDHNKVFYEMLNSDFEGMVKYIEENNDRQLILDIKNVLGV